ncbi:ER membrane protein [Schizosaccharomyces osmophilus]|uniref:ER membrane protein n=1 Tax=Schizosaccharomyces osmophilus TaxID=2545709 RepID=A0AAF0AVN5_9SCHI|nr:ER membrane protein [Schizosaccharomyces osmophilus]WBW72692.1 ER membrane protein [Schizosaccharomyces osmophilus]
MENLRKRIITYTGSKETYDEEDATPLSQQEQEAFIEHLRLTNTRDNRMFSILFSFLFLVLAVPVLLYPESFFYKLVEVLVLGSSAFVMYFLPTDYILGSPAIPFQWKVLLSSNIALPAAVFLFTIHKQSSILGALFSMRFLALAVSVFTELTRYSMYSAALGVEKLDNMRFA